MTYKRGDTGVENGTVTKHTSKIVGKGATVYGVILDHDQNKVVNTGFVHPDKLGFSIGAEVSIPWEYNYNEKQYRKAGASRVSAKSSKSVGTRQYQDRKFPMEITDPGRAIVRQNALGHAVQVCVHDMTFNSMTQLEDKATKVIQIAKIFEEYSSGFDVLKALKEADPE